MARPGLAAARDLPAATRGNVVLPDDEGYDGARRIWNGAVDHQPALLVLCKSAEDVRATARVARAHGLPLSVRGGGHDWAGRSLRHQGLVVNLSEMRQVEVDSRGQVATVTGGATAGDLIAAAAPHGLAAVTGSVGAVGMAGLTLAGGYGLLSPRCGLALDNLLGAELVLADGRLVTAYASENDELFWALRGGGNFGVVTSIRIRLHALRSLLAGLILFPWSQAESVLRGYAEAVASAPDELGVMAGVLSGPDGDPVVFLAPAWIGDPVQGKPVVARLSRLGTPLFVQIAPRTYADVLAMFDAHAVNGRHYAVQTRWLSELTPQIMSLLVEAGGTRTSPFSAIVLYHFHGAATRIPADATAFGLRREHFLVEMIAAWEPGAEDNGARHRRWAHDLSRAREPMALPGGCPNLLGPDELDQIALAYGANTARLKDLKRRFDPDSVFSATPLPDPSPQERSIPQRNACSARPQDLAETEQCPI
jgi:FAD/FMN-containing dehydrogenase